MRFRRRRPAYKPPAVRLVIDCPDLDAAPLVLMDLELLAACAVLAGGPWVLLSTDELAPGTVVRILLEHD